MAEIAIRSIRISQLQPGQTGVVQSAELEPDDAAFLRAMGLRLNSTIRLCRAGEPCIISVEGPHGCACRIGLSRPLAERVEVGVMEG